MKSAPRWTTEQLTAELRKAREAFREERIREPLEKWKEIFDQKSSEFRELLDRHGVADPRSLTPAKLGEIFQEGLGDALRYLAAPPISEDDLKVLAEASLAPTVLAKDADAAQRIIAKVKAGIWQREFGTRQIVPVAVLSGVFKVHNLEQAQTGGLTLFWAHKLDDMRTFIASTRP